MQGETNRMPFLANRLREKLVEKTSKVFEAQEIIDWAHDTKCKIPDATTCWVIESAIVDHECLAAAERMIDEMRSRPQAGARS